MHVASLKPQPTLKLELAVIWGKIISDSSALPNGNKLDNTNWRIAKIKYEQIGGKTCQEIPAQSDYVIYGWPLQKTLSDIEDAGGCQGKGKNVCPRTGQACGGGSTSSSGKL